MSKNKSIISIVFVLIIMIVGSFAYFNFVKPEKYMVVMKPLANDTIMDSLQVIMTFTPDGVAKLFATADTSALEFYRLQEGAYFSSPFDVALRSVEATMMRDEKLISDIPSSIDGFFGQNVTFVGILGQTQSLLDEMHFVQSSHFVAIANNENFDASVLPVKVYLSPDKHLKLFAPYYGNSALDGFSVSLVEGNITDFMQYQEGIIINEKKYYPLLIGKVEADMMRSEYLFSKPGDTIDDLFGNNYVVVGIINKTNSVIDMMHFTSIGALR